MTCIYRFTIFGSEARGWTRRPELEWLQALSTHHHHLLLIENTPFTLDKEQWPISSSFGFSKKIEEGFFQN
jgi:hypothetical protein